MLKRFDKVSEVILLPLKIYAQSDALMFMILDLLICYFSCHIFYYVLINQYGIFMVHTRELEEHYKGKKQA